MLIGDRPFKNLNQKFRAPRERNTHTAMCWQTYARYRGCETPRVGSTVCRRTSKMPPENFSTKTVVTGNHKPPPTLQKRNRHAELSRRTYARILSWGHQRHRSKLSSGRWQALWYTQWSWASESSIRGRPWFSRWSACRLSKRDGSWWWVAAKVRLQTTAWKQKRMQTRIKPIYIEHDRSEEQRHEACLVIYWHNKGDLAYFQCQRESKSYSYARHVILVSPPIWFQTVFEIENKGKQINERRASDSQTQYLNY